MIRRAPFLMLMLTLSGCVVRTAANVVTAPVRVTGWTYDRLTTSQAEADRKAGRRMRKEEAKRAKQQRAAAREAARQQGRPGGS